MAVIALRHPAAPAGETSGSAAQQVAEFLRGFSVGATMPSIAGIAALRAALPPRAKVHLAAVAGRPYSAIVETAVRVRAQGLEPVPHLCTRDIESRAALDDVLTRFTRWASVQRLLIVGGDTPRAKGPFGSALELIESGLLQRAGIREIAIAGYPEGHPERRTASSGRSPKARPMARPMALPMAGMEACSAGSPRISFPLPTPPQPRVGPRPPDQTGLCRKQARDSGSKRRRAASRRGP